MTRRQFLRLAIVTLGTVPVAAVALSRRGSAESGGGLDHRPGHVTGLPGPAVLVADFTRRGRRIRLTRRGTEIVMSIDGRDLGHHVFARVGGGFGSHLLPFREDRRPVDLALALVDGDGLLFVL